METTSMQSYSFHQVLNSHELGGAGLIALGLAKFIHTQGSQCHIWVPADGAMRQKAEEAELPHHLYSNSAASTQKIAAAVANGSFGYQLRRLGRGIVHVHSPAYYGALRVGLRIAGVSRVVHVHLEETGPGIGWAFKDPPEVIVTCARYMVDEVRQSLPESCRERQRIEAIPNAVDVETFFPSEKAAAKARLGAPLDRPLVIMLANLAPHKGQKTAIKTAALLKKQGIHIECWLAGQERQGGTSFTSELRALIAECGVQDRVKLLGYRDDSAELLRAADFFLLPSTHEGLPVSILEAQASEVPVLAAPTPGASEIIEDAATGFLIPHDRVEKYAEVVASLLANRDSHRRVAENAHAKVKRDFTWRGYCQKIWQLYGDLLDAQKKVNRASLSSFRVWLSLGLCL